MKKIFMAIALCLIAVLNFNANAQLAVSRETRSVITSNAFGDVVYQFNDGVYLGLEFWEDNGLNKKYHPSAGIKYLKLGDNISQAKISLNQMMDIMDENTDDVLTILTKDGEKLNIKRDYQGGLEFNFADFNSPYYSVIYKMRIKPLLKKL